MGGRRFWFYKLTLLLTMTCGTLACSEQNSKTSLASHSSMNTQAVVGERPQSSTQGEGNSAASRALNQPAGVPTSRGTVTYPITARPGGDPIVLNSEAFDFLVQDICEVNGRPTSIDPVACAQRGGRSRNASYGERLPYRRFTTHVTGVPHGMLEISDSVPILGPEGQTRVLHTFNIATPWDPTQPRSFMDFDAPKFADLFVLNSNYAAPTLTHSDGFEVAELDGPIISLIGTRDAHGIKPFYNANCEHDDTWVLFPKALPAPGSGGSLVSSMGYHLRPFEPRLNARGACLKAPTPSSSGTYFLRGAWRYNSGVVLDSMISTHYDAETAEKSIFAERFYYTKPYGRTRWEAWARADQATQPMDRSCTGPAEEMIGGIRFIRYVCREFTSTAPDPFNGFEPMTLPLAGFMGGGNLLFNAGFASSLRFENWQFTGSTISSGQVITESAPQQSLLIGNRHARFRNLASGSIYQDIDLAQIPERTRVLRYGVTAWSNTSSSQIDVGVWQFRPSGPVFSSLRSKLSGDRTPLRDELILFPDTQSLRFEVYLVGENADIFLDDAWVAPDFAATTAINPPQPSPIATPVQRSSPPQMTPQPVPQVTQVLSPRVNWISDPLGPNRFRHSLAAWIPFEQGMGDQFCRSRSPTSRALMTQSKSTRAKVYICNIRIEVDPSKNLFCSEGITGSLHEGQIFSEIACSP